MTLGDAAGSEVLIKLETVMEKEKSELAQTSKTSQLWLNYPGLFGMVRMLIRRIDWILVDAFAGSVLLPKCRCCSWAPQLPAYSLLLPAENEKPGGKAPRCVSKVP